MSELPETITFKPELIARIVNLDREDKLKVSQDALKLWAEYLRIFVIEATHRAECTARADMSSSVEPEHLEKILPQLLLDFC
eukprot:m.8211 g.8211  ORF g.8211 m.8211 type:complete len:82 (-) comp2835_c0_seq2:78-323(-)